MSKYSQKTWDRLRKKVRKFGHYILMSDGTTRLLDKWAKNKGFENYWEYMDDVAIGREFTCYEEYMDAWKYYPGMPNPTKENRLLKSFIGSYIAENGISKLFEGCQKMKKNNPGYDIICPKGYKLDVKASVLSRFNTFGFHIAKNQIADYFILVGFDNVINLKPLYLWILKRDDIVRGRCIKDIEGIYVSNDPESIKQFEKYSRIYKLKELTNICEEFNKHANIEIFNDNIPTRSHILDIRSRIKLSGKKDITNQDILNILKDEPKIERKQKIECRLQLVPEEDCK